MKITAIKNTIIKNNGIQELIQTLRDTGREKDIQSEIKKLSDKNFKVQK
jgi:hypothetical protein